jgi:ABC-2 type transport system ATP-binding protein
MNNQTVIRVKDLTKYYGSRLGIKNLNFEVKAGEIFGFLGPNGAGKTTTIRLLLDLLRPTSGSIELMGQKLPQNSLEVRKKTGYLPGDFTAYQHLTVEEFLNFISAIRKLAWKPEFKLIDLLSFRKNLNHKIKHLSHGNRQKLGIIQTFIHDPELVILDEPTTGLDPIVQEEFYEFLEEYRDLGNTIFFSSHNLPEVEKICHRVAIIREGTLVALETLEHLKKKRYRRLKLVLSRPITELKLEGAELIKSHQLVFEFLIKGELAPILKKLATLPVRDIVLPEPDLEEVFLYYYRGKDEQ